MADPKLSNLLKKSQRTILPDPRSIDFFKDIESIIDSVGPYSKKNEKEVLEVDPKRPQKNARKELLTQQRILVNVILQEKIRGLLVFHGLGSGKTCASIASALALYKTRKISNVIILLPKSIRPNFMAEIETCTPGGLKLEPEGEMYRIFHYNSSNLIESMMSAFECNDVETLIEKLSKSLFIVDESHRLIQMMHNSLVAMEKMPDYKKNEFRQKSKGYKIYQILMKVNMAKILLLSGTPLTNYAYEAAVLGNIISGYININSQKYTLFPENSDLFYRKYVDEDAYKIFDKSIGDFERRFIGKITYFPNISNSQFPEIIENRMIRCQMNPMQINFYNEMVKIDQQKKSIGGNVRTSLTSTYRIFSRMSSNFVFPPDFYERYLQKFISKNNIDQNVFEYSDFMSHGPLMKQITEKNIKTYISIIADFMSKFKQISNLYFYKNLSDFSCKYAELKNILSEKLNQNTPKKTLIYSNFKNYAGLYTIELLLNSLGLRRFEPEAGFIPEAASSSQELELVNLQEQIEKGEDEYQHEEAANSDFENENNMTVDGGGGGGTGARGEKSFKEFKFPEINEIFSVQELKILTEINRELSKKKMGYLVYMGKNLQRIISIFNDAKNIEGNVIPVLVITSAGSEGISLKNTRYVHIMEPYWNQNRTEQVIGRARRHRSHIELPNQYQNVSVYQYITSIAGEETIDESILQIATKKKRIIDYIYNIFMDVSVDCKKLSRKTCTPYKYDMSTFNPDVIKSKYLYDYFDSQGRQKYDNIDRYTQQKYYKMYPLSINETDANTKYFLGKAENNNRNNKWKIVELATGRDGIFYSVEGSIKKIPGDNQYYVVIDNNNMPMYKLRIDALKNRKIDRVNIDKNTQTLGSQNNISPPYPYRNNEENPVTETKWNEMD